MKRLLKLFAGLFAGGISLMIIAVLGVVFLVKPDNFKSTMSHGVAQFTGRSFEINGPLAWTFSPSLGLALNQIELANPTNFQNSMMRINSAVMGVKFGSLLHRQLQIEQLALKDIQLNLVRSTAGNNWQDLLKPKAFHVAASKTTGSAALIPFTKKEIAISKLSLQNMKINFQDLLHQSNVQVDNFNLNANQLSFKHNILKTLKTEAIVSASYLNYNSLTARDITASVQAEQGKFNVPQFHAKIADGEWSGAVKIDVTGGAPHFNIEEKIQGVPVKTLIDALNFQGRSTLGHLSHALDRLPITGVGDMVLSLAGTGNTSTLVRKNLSGKFEFNFHSGLMAGFEARDFLSTEIAKLIELAVPHNAQSQNTTFTRFTGKFIIEHGEAFTDNILLEAPYLQMTGKGTIDLVLEKIDMEFIVKPVHESRFKAIPVRITGPLAQMQIALDIPKALSLQVTERKEMLQQAITQEIKNRLRLKIGRIK